MLSQNEKNYLQQWLCADNGLIHGILTDELSDKSQKKLALSALIELYHGDGDAAYQLAKPQLPTELRKMTRALKNIFNYPEDCLIELRKAFPQSQGNQGDLLHYIAKEIHAAEILLDNVFVQQLSDHVNYQKQRIEAYHQQSRELHLTKTELRKEVNESRRRLRLSIDDTEKLSKQLQIIRARERRLTDQNKGLIKLIEEYKEKTSSSKSSGSQQMSISPDISSGGQQELTRIEFSEHFNSDIEEYSMSTSPLQEPAIEKTLIVESPMRQSVSSSNIMNEDAAFAEHNEIRILKQLLLDSQNQNVNNLLDNGHTILTMLCNKPKDESNHLDENLIRLLIRNGASVTLANKKGKRPIDYAIYHERDNLFHLLRNATHQEGESLTQSQIANHVDETEQQESHAEQELSQEYKTPKKNKRKFVQLPTTPVAHQSPRQAMKKVRLRPTPLTPMQDPNQLASLSSPHFSPKSHQSHLPQFDNFKSTDALPSSEKATQSSDEIEHESETEGGQKENARPVTI